jgi:predicted ABC-type transport system involved in lysophospholipase L1 biosynthesis ATPase subunit
LIQADSLSRIYGDGDGRIAAVNDLNFCIQEGQRTAIIGKSGSGKSTLLNLLAGLDRPSAGSLTVDGRRLDRLSRTEMAAYRRDTVGMVFQAFQLIPQRTALQNVELPLILSGVPKTERQRLAGDWLCRVGLEARLHHLPYALSGGEQQRVAIARALVHGPKLLLADEPTGNLDTATAEQVERLMMDLCAESRVTFVMVTHNEQLAERMSDRRFSMHDGLLSEL